MINSELKFELEEIWKDIPGYIGKYQVSNLGNVRSLNYHSTGKTSLLKFAVDKKGYFRCALSKKNRLVTYKVHRLVAGSFLPNPKELPQVNHIDGNKQNNNANNLEWTDNSENQIHAWKNGLQPSFRRRKLHGYLSQIEVLLSKGYKCSQVASVFGVTTSSLQRYARKNGVNILAHTSSRSIAAKGESGYYTVYPSIKCAAAQEGLDYQCIQRALLNKKKYGGAYWEYYSLPDINEFVKNL